MERGIRRFLNTPPQPHSKGPKSPPPHQAERAAGVEGPRPQGQGAELNILQIEIDSDVRSVLEFMQTTIPCERLVSVAEGVSA